MSSESWLPIPDHDGYEASSLGRVRGRRGLLAVFPMKSGYLTTALGGHYRNTVHAIVALAFHGPRPRGMCVAHVNGKRDDNRAENLQYTTYSGNSLHARSHGSRPCPLLALSNKWQRRIDEKNRGRMAHGIRHGMATSTEADVMRVHELIGSGMLIKEVATATGKRYGWVAGIVSGRRWRHLHPDLALRK